MTRILIIKLGALGDVLRTTSILPGLHNKYSDACITWITSASALTLLQGNPRIDRLITFDEVDMADIIKEHFDLIISLEDSLTASQFAGQFSSTDFFGVYTTTSGTSYTPNSAQWFDMSLVSSLGRTRADELKKANTCSYPDILFGGLGLCEGSPSMAISSKAIQFADQFARRLNLSDCVTIGLNTGAGSRWQFKQLDIPKTIELAEKLYQETNANILLFGGPAEGERNQLIIDQAQCPIIDTGTKNSIQEFASLIALCDILITSDSLALHIASAASIPTVVFFGPTSSAEIRLFSPGQKIVPPISCVVCYKERCEIRPSCMDKLSIDEIIQATLLVLPDGDASLPAV
jgi:heptosyltransferase II